MIRKKITRSLVPACSMVLILSTQAYAQIQVVNMVPQLQSNEIKHDNETNIAVNPANRLQMVGSAFTPDPLNGPNAPIYITTDGGTTWSLNSILPGNSTSFGTGDITVRFAGSGNQLYTGILRGDAFLVLNIFRVPDYTSATVPTPLVSRASVDQPYVQANTLLGGEGTTKDRVYAAINERSTSPLTAGIDFSLDAFSTPSPGGFTTAQVPSKVGATRVQPGVRPTIHPSGVIYIAYYSQTATGADVVVARDDNWANNATPFQALLDGPGGTPGKRVVTGRTLPAFGVNVLGNNRLVASNISVAVDPRNSATVYVAWADRVGLSDYTLHVRRSDDSGDNWSGDLITITNATNPALAVNSNGKVAFLYQQLTGLGASQRWDTHLRRSINAGGVWDDLLLSTSLINNPAAVGTFCLGDYDHIMAVDKDFFGIFPASNFPDMANFPQGVSYQRNANFVTNQLLGNDGITVVNTSIDPFFFHVTEIASADDFFVRDFTNSVTDFDPGLEPSTYPWFYHNSDVWNKRSNAPGSFNGNNQPVSEDPWETTNGQNFAFSRVHRKAAGPAQSVTLHYLYSEFGTGSNFINANTTADPTLAFGAADLELTTPAGYAWDLPVTTSTHTCLAVEISTPSDPLITPSLLGHAPGWSNGTDLMVLMDNNKAQRNMSVYYPPGSGSANSGINTYAAIHNAGMYMTDMNINWRIDPRVKSPVVVRGIGDRKKTKTGESTIALMNMQPGETRFIQIMNTKPAGKAGETVATDFSQVKNDMVSNGFTIVQAITDMTNAAVKTIKYESSVFRRIAWLYKNDIAASIQKRDLEALDAKQIDDKSYTEYNRKNFSDIKKALAELLKNNPNDPFALKGALDQMGNQLANGNPADLAFTHISLLNATDAFITSLELEKGNVADILQTVYLQLNVFRVWNERNNSVCSKTILSGSIKFIDQFEKRQITGKDYPEFIKQLLPQLKSCMETVPGGNPEFVMRLKAIEDGFTSLAGLQKAHINFLLLFRRLTTN